MAIIPCPEFNKQRTGMSKGLVYAVVLVCSLSGCSHLIIRPDDSAGAKVAKFTTRAVLVVPTLIWSEVFMAKAKFEDGLRTSKENLDLAFVACRDAEPGTDDHRRACQTFEYLRANHAGLVGNYQRWASGVAETAAASGQAAAQSMQSFRSGTQRHTITTPNGMVRCSTTTYGSQARTNCY